jgi:hypothetical protein
MGGSGANAFLFGFRQIKPGAGHQRIELRLIEGLGHRGLLSAVMALWEILAREGTGRGEIRLVLILFF